MAVPTVVNVAAAATATTGALTPAFPASLVADDILVGIGECLGNSVLTPPAGWAHVTGSPNNITTVTRLTVIWKRYVVGDAAASWGTPGDHAIGRIIAIRGVRTNGTPWNATPITSQDTVAQTTATWPSVNTSAGDCLILFIIATGRDANSTANLGALTGGTGLTSVTERMDDWTLSGGGGGIGMVTASMVTAGPTGAPTATMGSADAKALMTLAIRSPEPAGDPFSYTPGAWGNGPMF